MRKPQFRPVEPHAASPLRGVLGASASILCTSHVLALLLSAGGSAAGRRIWSEPGEQTRPMMERVRGALFAMLGSRLGTLHAMPPSARWLDLFAGTGSVGLEALSRGCACCSFDVCIMLRFACFQHLCRSPPAPHLDILQCCFHGWHVDQRHRGLPESLAVIWSSFI